MDQNMPIHTTGPRGGTPVIDGNNQSGGSLRVRAFTAAVGLRLHRGDTFSIGDTTTKVGVYGVNPRSRATVGRFQDFTCLADVYSDAAGVAVIPIWPPIILDPDPRQTVQQMPVDAMTLNFRGTADTQYAQNLFFQKNAFTLASVDIEVPQGDVKWSRAVDPDAGVSMQAAIQFDIRSYQNLSRVDTLYGATALRPECCVRVWSKATIDIP
jgi:coat protein Gp5